jgi:hypothetical protein
MTIEIPFTPYYRHLLPVSKLPALTLMAEASGQSLQVTTRQPIEATEMHYHDHIEHGIALVGSAHKPFHESKNNLEALEASQAIVLLCLFVLAMAARKKTRRRQKLPR